TRSPRHSRARAPARGRPRGCSPTRSAPPPVPGATSPAWRGARSGPAPPRPAGTWRRWAGRGNPSPPPGTDGIHRACRPHASSPSLGNLRLVPALVAGHRHHHVGPPAERLSELVLLGLGRGHHPDVAIVVAAELALGVGPVGRGGEQRGRA